MLARHADAIRLSGHRQVTIRHEFGGMRKVGDILGALGFPRIWFWDSSLVRHLTSNVDFDAFFGGTVGFDPFETHLGVPIQRRVGVYLCCADRAQVPWTQRYV